LIIENYSKKEFVGQPYIIVVQYHDPFLLSPVYSPYEC